MMNFVHGVDTRSALFPVGDEGVSIDMGCWKGTLSVNDVFGNLSKRVVLGIGENTFPDKISVSVP